MVILFVGIANPAHALLLDDFSRGHPITRDTTYDGFLEPDSPVRLHTGTDLNEPLRSGMSHCTGGCVDGPFNSVGIQMSVHDGMYHHVQDPGVIGWTGVAWNHFGIVDLIPDGNFSLEYDVTYCNLCELGEISPTIEFWMFPITGTPGFGLEGWVRSAPIALTTGQHSIGMNQFGPSFGFKFDTVTYISMNIDGQATPGLEVSVDSINFVSTPEPTSFLLLGSGLLGIGFIFGCQKAKPNNSVLEANRKSDNWNLGGSFTFLNN